MALPRNFTVAELYAMPGSGWGERYELIDGELLVTPSPATRHQIVSGNLYLYLSAHVRSLRLG